MSIILSLFVMCIGFIALYFGAEWLVEGAVTMATHLRISKMVAGLILVAFGTSAPELFVNGIAAVRSESGASFALSNISGSNLANLLLGFGLCAVLSQTVIAGKKFHIDLIALCLAPLVLFLLMASNGNSLPIWGGAILVLGFIYYILQNKKRLYDEDEVDIEIDKSLPQGLFWFLLGIGLLYVGGDITVRQAVSIGQMLNISDAILGLTVVALGTSIPDITASVIAAKAGENEIAVGNLLGSNVFNILFVIPATQLISLLANRPILQADQAVLTSFIVVTIVSCSFFIWVHWRDKLTKSVGTVMLAAYFFYMVYRVFGASIS